MGLFYSPPLPNIGAQQPLAPEQLTPQSGPAPQNPPLIGSLIGQAILNCWFVPAALIILPQLLIPQSAPVASLPQPQRSLQEVYRTWEVPPPAPITARPLNPAIFGPAPQNPPIVGAIVPLAVQVAWLPPAPASIVTINLNPPISGPAPSSSPIVGAQIPLAVQVAWLPPQAQPYFGEYEPYQPPTLSPPVSGPSPQNPPLTSAINPAILNSWAIAPIAVALEQAGIPQSLPVAISPLRWPWEIYRSWDAAPPAPIVGSKLVPISGPASQNPPFAGARFAVELEVSWLPAPPAPIVASIYNPAVGGSQQQSSNPPIVGSVVPVAVQLAWLPPSPAPITAAKFVPPSRSQNPPFAGARFATELEVSWLPAPPAPIVAININPALQAVPAAAYVPPGAQIPFAVQISWLPSTFAVPTVSRLTPPLSGPAPQNPPFAGARFATEIEITWLAPLPAPVVAVTFNPAVIAAPTPISRQVHFTPQPSGVARASDPRMVTAYRRALALKGIPVVVTRVTGFAPNTVTFSSTLMAIVENYTPDSTAVAETGFSSSKVGAISQGDRMVILMSDDLVQQNFPLPLQKNDKIALPTGDVLNVEQVDSYKRALAGAIELKATGIA